jgi:5'-deoxynucleotidase YfbR-like HD superfamily hydrolase
MVKPEISMIDYVRNGMRVRRFHTVDMHVTETVGHHSANVAMLCQIIHPDCRKELLLAALTHDLTEQFTGDVPATAKWGSPALAVALNDLEEGYEKFPTDLSSFEVSVLKQADMLDLCFKCAEEVRMGNSFAATILGRGVAYLRRNKPLDVVKQFIRELDHEFGE